MGNHKRLEIDEILDLAATDDRNITLRKAIEKDVVAIIYPGWSCNILRLFPSNVARPIGTTDDLKKQGFSLLYYYKEQGVQVWAKQPNESSISTIQSERAFFIYTSALERGDIDTVQSILAQAETDPALEQMILDLNQHYAEVDQEAKESEE